MAEGSRQPAAVAACQPQIVGAPALAGLAQGLQQPNRRLRHNRRSPSLPPMSANLWTLQIHPQAPPKPGFGAPCNGCGVCCLHAPCPLGMLLSRRRHGRCRALDWDSGQACYRCGALLRPAATLQASWPGLPARLRPLTTAALQRLAQRWIGLGLGCDCDLEVEFPDNRRL